MTSKGREAVEKAIIRKGFLPYLSLQLPIIGACTQRQKSGHASTVINPLLLMMLSKNLT